MNHFLIEVDYFGEWTIEGYFNTLGQAFEFGKEFFSRKIWRVMDSYSGIMVYSNDPLYQTQFPGLSEIDRFNAAERAHRRQIRNDLISPRRRSMPRIFDFSIQNISARHLGYIYKLKENTKEQINWKKDGF